MDDGPGGRTVTCPECGAKAIAVVPKNTTPADGEDEADGKVWVNCHECRNRFLTFYRTQTDDD